MRWSLATSPTSQTISSLDYCIYRRCFLSVPSSHPSTDAWLLAPFAMLSNSFPFHSARNYVREKQLAKSETQARLRMNSSSLVKLLLVYPLSEVALLLSLSLLFWNTSWKRHHFALAFITWHWIVCRSVYCDSQSEHFNAAHLNSFTLLLYRRARGAMHTAHMQTSSLIKCYHKRKKPSNPIENRMEIGAESCSKKKCFEQSLDESDEHNEKLY